MENSANVGKYLLKKLNGLKEIHPLIGDCRGLGLLSGVELVKDQKTKESFTPESGLADKLSKAFRRNGLILFSTEKGFTVGPPLCIIEKEVDEIVSKIDASLSEVETQIKIG